MAKRRNSETDPTAKAEGDVMGIIPLGAGNEVGRSCIILKFKGKTIMLDCGIHPGYSGMAALPFFDEVDAGEIDLLLVTHFHLDHAASLPYFTEKTNFRGRIFMTHPTKAVMQMMLRDYVRISNIATDAQLYDEKDLNRCIEKVETIDFHQEREVSGIKFWPYNAGHVLGAAMFMLEFGGVRVLYTGDYSREDDRHLMAAEIPSVSPDVLIVESTYGVQVHQAIAEREARFTGLVEAVVRRGGRCLIPSFALGRSQELLLILDEHWRANRDLHDIPIYFASKIAAKALRVYQTYVNMMNERMRKQISVSNPFRFQHISNLKSLEDFDDAGPCVVMASPAMLDSGVSRELFDRWCSDRRNGCIIPGYVVEGTLAKKILSEPSEVTTLDGRVVPLACTVEYISFSAHADFVQTSTFIDEIKVPPNIVLVHGEQNEMMRLKGALHKKYKNRQDAPKLLTPANCVEVEIVFRGEKMAKAIGSLASEEPRDGNHVEGVLVQHDFNTHLMAPADLQTYTHLLATAVRQRQHVPFYRSYEVLRLFLEQMFEDVALATPEGAQIAWGESSHGADGLNNNNNNNHCEIGTTVIVAGEVSVTYSGDGKVVVEWEASPVNDMLADSVIAVLFQAQCSPSSIKLSKPVRCCHSGRSHSHETSTRQDKQQQQRQQQQQQPEEEEEEELWRKLGEDGVRAEILEEDEDNLNLLVIFRALRERFGKGASVDWKTKQIAVEVDDSRAVVDLDNAAVRCKDKDLRRTLQETLRKVQTALYPVTLH